MKAQRQKRVAINVNDTFANIELITQATEALATLPAATTTRRQRTAPSTATDRNLVDQLAPFLNQFNANDVVE